MTRLFVSLLLIPMLMIGPARPHVHAAAGFDTPNPHSQLPHIHLGRGHHHAHDGSEHHHAHDGDHSHHGHEHSDQHHGDRDQSEDSQVSPLVALTSHSDHDSDAVYLPSSDWSASRLVEQIDCQCPPPIWGPTSSWAPAPARCLASENGKPDRISALPVYLLTASLRL